MAHLPAVEIVAVLCLSSCIFLFIDYIIQVDNYINADNTWLLCKSEERPWKGLVSRIHTYACSYHAVLLTQPYALFFLVVSYFPLWKRRIKGDLGLFLDLGKERFLQSKYGCSSTTILGWEYVFSSALFTGHARIHWYSTFSNHPTAKKSEICSR